MQQVNELNLSQFYGTENLYRFSLISKSVITDGCKYLADHAKAYWLFDAIDSHLITKKLHKESHFFVVKFTKNNNSSGELLLDDGNGLIFAIQKIPFTDFPLEAIQLYSVWNGEFWTHMLTSEY